VIFFHVGGNNQRLIFKSIRGGILLCLFCRGNRCHFGLVWRLWANAVSIYILMTVHILTEWGCPSPQTHMFLCPEPLKPSRRHKFSQLAQSQNTFCKQTEFISLFVRPMPWIQLPYSNVFEIYSVLNKWLM